MATPTTISAPQSSPYAALREKSLTKARVYWAASTNGATHMDYYSFDTSGKYQVADPRDYGIRGLKKMVDKMGDKVSRCIIYDRKNGGEVCRKEKGLWSN